jgi:tripartite-type tricarboxylate transporter receptor subunit TctC
MSKNFWRARRVLLGMTLFVALTPSLSGAMDYPSKPVRFVIPFPAGGATDLIARVVGQKLSATWGQPVVPDNVSGATGTIGAAQIARAAPDGYNLLVGTASVNSVLPSVRSGLAFDTLRDYEEVSMLATFPNILVVRPDFPAKSISEMVALLKANPNKFTFGSSGFGGSIHLAGELFKLRTGTQMTHVAYKGSAPALAELLAGHVDMMFDNLADVASFIKNGDLRPLGVASATRNSFVPNVPAIAETLSGFEATTWVGLLAPAKTPVEVITKIDTDVKQSFKDPEVAQALRNMAANPGSMTPNEFAGYVRDDVEKWRRVVQDAHLTVE